MVKLSLCEIVQSQLSITPIINGQLVCCTDTGRFYRDLGTSRIELSQNIITVDSLPLAPISGKIYLLKPNKLYLYDNEWILINQIPHTVITEDTIYSFPITGDENCIYIARQTNRLYRWDNTALKYYCIGSNYDEIKIINGGNATN